MSNAISAANMAIISQIISEADDRIMLNCGVADDNKSVVRFASVLNAIVRGGNDLTTGVISGCVLSAAGGTTVAFTSGDISINGVTGTAAAVATSNVGFETTGNANIDGAGLTLCTGEAYGITFYLPKSGALSSVKGEKALPENVIYPCPPAPSCIVVGHVLMGYQTSAVAIPASSVISFASDVASLTSFTGFESDSGMELFAKTYPLESIFGSNVLTSQRTKFNEFISGVEALTLAETGQDFRTYYGSDNTTNRVLFGRGFKEVYKACRGVYPHTRLASIASTSASATIGGTYYDGTNTSATYTLVAGRTGFLTTDPATLPGPTGIQLVVASGAASGAVDVEHTIKIWYVDDSVYTTLTASAAASGSLTVASTVGFDAVAPGYCRVGAEIIKYSAVTIPGTAITSTGRGQFATGGTYNTAASIHNVGDKVYACKSIDVVVPAGTAFGSTISIPVTTTDVVGATIAKAAGTIISYFVITNV